MAVLHALEIAALEAASVWPYLPQVLPKKEGGFLGPRARGPGLDSLPVMLVTGKLPGVLGAIDLGDRVFVIHCIWDLTLGRL